ncbi:MAG: RNA methyltransferase [Thermoanaerobaculia bacterium]|nr:RNA methyltransferase [Thermoanaerobaculia bacterium]
MITSARNRWLKDIRRLRRSKDEGRWLLEGPHLLQEALSTGVELEVTLATEEFLTAAASYSGSEAARVLRDLPRPPLCVDAALLDDLADADSPKGLVAIARREPCRLADIAVEHEDESVYVFADGLQDPGNLGALVRVIEAAGAAGLLLGQGSCRLSHPRAVRASAGSLLRLPAVENVTAGEVDRHLSTGCLTRPTRWLGLAPRGGTDLYSADLTGPLVLAVGGEGPGLGSPVAERADELVTIPTAGRVESLNATVAAAVVLFEIARRRREERKEC